MLYTFIPTGYIGGNIPAWGRWRDVVVNWSPNSKWLAFETFESADATKTNTGNQSYTQVYDYKGNFITKWKLGGGGTSPMWSPNGEWLAISSFNQKSAMSTIVFVETETWDAYQININGDLEIIDWIKEQ